jgi:enoyl-CoA hydratase
MRNQDLLIERQGAAVIVTLNRPQALNALSQSIIEDLSEGLALWSVDDTVDLVILQGAGDRAFCAGGDVRYCYDEYIKAKESGEKLNHVIDFFKLEYSLNKMMFHYRKPIFAFMDGIVMGGGYGLGGQCQYRIVTERTRFAMPEVSIGLFPDVGSAYHLVRSTSYRGHFLALTGLTVNADDMLYADLADFYIESKDIEVVKKALIQGDNPEQVLYRYRGVPPKGLLRSRNHQIRKNFSERGIDKILLRLSRGDDWEQEIASIIRLRSPTSLYVTYEHLRRARWRSFNYVIAEDFNLVQKFLAGPDFYEGVRAAVIDKDQKPTWRPASLAEVNQEDIKEYFTKSAYSL